MADEATTEAEATEEAPQEEAQATDWKAEARKWEKRAKANAKALDELKASKEGEPDAHAEELAKARERIKELEAQQERDRKVRAIAKTSGVDPDILLKMSGNTDEEIEENASMLAKSSKAKWPTVPDDGDNRNQKRMTREQILAIKDQGRRVEEIARNSDLFK